MAATTTAQMIFDLAMTLSDNLVEGLSDVTANADYKYRSLALINSRAKELYRYSDSAVPDGLVRPNFISVTTFSEFLDLDDGLAMGVLPHGLVSDLFSVENPSLSNREEARYNETLEKFRNFPKAWEAITDEYGITDYSDAGD
jgi:hypothetical protein